MWVLKFHGETLYVNHVDSRLPWSTKETGDNPHTKGSLKFKNALLCINENNEAIISELTIYDKFRLRNQKLGITRIMFRPNSAIHLGLQKNEFKHSPFKNILGACATGFVICDLLKKEEATFALLKYADQVRVLKPNESYYQAYDDTHGDRISVDYSDEDTPYEYS